jgi:hypothetical protein
MKEVRRSSQNLTRMSSRTYTEDEVKALVERAIRMAWEVGDEGGLVEEVTYEDVVSGADYD